MSEPRDPTAGGPAGEDPTAGGEYGEPAGPPGTGSGRPADRPAAYPPAPSGDRSATDGPPAYPPAPSAGGLPTGGAGDHPYPPPRPAGIPYGGGQPVGPYARDPYADQPGGNPYAGPPPPPPGYAGPAPWRAGPEDTTWATLAHVLGIFFSFVPPLVVLLAKGGSSGFVRDQAIEALNFQITVIIGYVVSAILIILVIGLIMFFFVGVASLILGIVGALAASRGEAYRYPVNLRIIR